MAFLVMWCWSPGHLRGNFWVCHSAPLVEALLFLLQSLPRALTFQKNKPCKAPLFCSFLLEVHDMQSLPLPVCIGFDHGITHFISPKQTIPVSGVPCLPCCEFSLCTQVLSVICFTSNQKFLISFLTFFTFFNQGLQQNNMLLWVCVLKIFF